MKIKKYYFVHKIILLTLCIAMGVLGLYLIFGHENSTTENPLIFTTPLSLSQVKKMDMALEGVTILDIQDMVVNNILNYETLTRYYLARIKLYDGKLNSVISTNPHAIEEAKEKDRNITHKNHPIYGIPVLLKDNISTSDMYTTAGALALKEFLPGQDALVVKKLRSYGAVILGKTNLSEWANALTLNVAPNGFSVLGGQTYNPYNKDFEVGGSSSGSAVAVVSELTTVSIGTETTGSIIYPSALNGVYGLRPSDGIISRDHIIPFTEHFDTVGPMTRNAVDMLILLSTMVGYDKNDFKSVDVELFNFDIFDVDIDYLTQYQKTRIGIINNPIGFPEDFEYSTNLTTSQWNALADIFHFLGIDTEFMSFDVSKLMQTAADIHRMVMLQGVKQDIDAYFKTVETKDTVLSLKEVVEFNRNHKSSAIPYGQKFFELALRSDSIPKNELEQKLETFRTMARNEIKQALDTHHVAFLIYSGLNLAGHQVLGGYPALSIPMGYGKDGRPINITIMGEKFTDVKLIRIALGIERALVEASNHKLKQ